MKYQQAIAAFISIAAIIFAASFKDKGDHEPWCNFPKTFKPTMKTADTTVDIARYMGTWYEIVRKGGDAFQGNCICSQADYSLSADKTFVNVDNTCIDKFHRKEEAVGTAYSQNAQNTQLEVYFNPKVGGNYWILALDTNYGYVLVGEPCRKMLWVLSRQKTLDKAIVDQLLQVAYGQGYTSDNLVYRNPSC